MKACKVLERLGVTRRTLSNYVKSGRIRVKKTDNGFYEYDEKDIAEIEKNTVNANAVIITQENGISHRFALTYEQAVELTKIITDFLKP